jgi:hypothetical protein
MTKMHGVNSVKFVIDSLLDFNKLHFLGFIFGVFAKLKKATINFVISVRPLGTTRLPLDGFS